MKLSKILDIVNVKNRVVDAPVKLVFDAEEVVFEAGQVYPMPRDIADWFVHKSMFRLDPETQKIDTRLVILGSGADESDLTRAVAGRAELFDRTGVGPTHFTADGKPLRPEYVNVSHLAGEVRAEESKFRVDPERQAKEEVAAERRDQLTDKLADAAAKLPAEEIEKAAHQAFAGDVPGPRRPAAAASRGGR